MTDYDNSLTSLLSALEADDPTAAPTTVNPSQQIVTTFLDPDAEAPTLPGEMQAMQARLTVYNHEMPFTGTARRRILSNMLFMEATTAVKGSDRLKAIELLGKTEGVSLFAPEKQVVEIKNADELRSALKDKLGALLDGEWERLPDVTPETDDE